MPHETAELHFLVNRLFINLDERRYHELAELFAADGVWHRQGKALQGPAGIRNALERRPRDLTTCHLVTNFAPDITGPDSAKSLQYITAYAHEGELSDGTVPIGPSGPDRCVPSQVRQAAEMAVRRALGHACLPEGQ